MDNAQQMRDFSEFCEQLNEMRVRFHKWDSCERTVALYYLMVGLPFANAKFLQHALEQCIAAVNTPESQQLERNANDPQFIKQLLGERPQIALTLLLAHLPLLKPGNKTTADCYMLTIRKVLSEFITPPYKIYNECVEIMSYVFVHPAFDKDDKKSFKQLLKQVLNRVTPENFVHSPVNESSDESISPNSEPINYMKETTRLNRRSNSLTTTTPNSNENLIPHSDVWSSQENLTNQHTCKPRSYSLSSDKTINILHNTLQSSSSETRLQDLQTLNNLPTMKSIVSWLKSLRLHKYSWVFNNLTYDQMLNLTEDSLQAIGITKGARHKLLLSIMKLKERSGMLLELETDVMNGGDLLSALKKLKSVLQSPLQIVNGEDLPSQFVKVMGKVCTQLLMLRQPSDECLVLFSTLCERAETSEAFTIEQKRRLGLWRGQLNRNSHTTTTLTTTNSTYSQQQSTTTTTTYNRHPNSLTTTIASPIGGSVPISTTTHQQQQQNYNTTHKSSSYPNVQNNQVMVVGGHRHSIGSITMNNVSIPITTSSSNSSVNCFEQPPPPTTTTTNHHHYSSSYASNNLHHHHHHHHHNNHQHHVRFQDTEFIDKGKMTTKTKTTTTTTTQQLLKNIDIESSLESLCLQMMEHALGP